MSASRSQLGARPFSPEVWCRGEGLRGLGADRILMLEASFALAGAGRASLTGNDRYQYHYHAQSPYGTKIIPAKIR